MAPKKVLPAPKKPTIPASGAAAAPMKKPAAKVSAPAKVPAPAKTTAGRSAVKPVPTTGRTGAASAATTKSTVKPTAPRAPAKPTTAPVAAPKASAPAPCFGVYVAPWGMGSVSDAEKIFSAAGTVVSARIRRNRFALVHFNNAAAVKKAIELFHHQLLLGKVVEVTAATSNPRPDPHANSSVVHISPIFRCNTPKNEVKKLLEGVKILRIRMYRGNYVYAYFDSPETAQAVMQKLNNTKFHGHKLTVKLSTRSLEKDRRRFEAAAARMHA